MKNRIKKYRLKIGMSQEALGALSGLGLRAVYDLETGGRALTPETAARLADTLGTSAEELMLF